MKMWPHFEPFWELLMRIEEIGKLPERDQRLLTVILDTFIEKRRLEELEEELYEI